VCSPAADAGKNVFLSVQQEAPISSVPNSITATNQIQLKRAGEPPENEQAKRAFLILER